MQPSSTGQAAVFQTKTDRIMIVTVVAGHAIKHLFNAGFFILLPEIKSGMNLSNAAVGAISTSRQIAGGVVNFPAGFLADRFPHKWAEFLGLSIALVGLFYLLLGSAPNYAVVVIAAILSNIAITMWHPAAIAALSRRFVQQRGLVVSLHGTGGSIGEAIGPLVAGGLLLVIGWQLILQGTLIPGLIAGAGIWLLLRGLPVQRERGASLAVYLDALKPQLRNRRLLTILLVVAGFTTTQGTIFTFLPIYLREDVGYSAFRTGVYLSAAQIVGIGSQPIMGLLSDRYGRQVVLLPGIIGLALAVLALSVAPAGIPLLLAVAAMGAFAFPLMAILLAAAGDIAGEQLQATSVSLVFGAAMVFGGISPVISGLLADAFEVKTTFLFAGGVAVLTAIFVGTQRWPGSGQKTGSRGVGSEQDQPR